MVPSPAGLGAVRVGEDSGAYCPDENGCGGRRISLTIGATVEEPTAAEQPGATKKPDCKDDSDPDDAAGSGGREQTVTTAYNKSSVTKKTTRTVRVLGLAFEVNGQWALHLV